MTDAELVRLAAEKVMGWTEDESGVSMDDDTFIIYGSKEQPMLSVDGNEVWNPLTSISDAWMLVEKLWDEQNGGWQIGIQTEDGGRIRCTVNKDGAYCGHCTLESASGAITYAALRAVGEEV